MKIYATNYKFSYLLFYEKINNDLESPFLLIKFYGYYPKHQSFKLTFICELKIKEIPKDNKNVSLIYEYNLITIIFEDIIISYSFNPVLILKIIMNLLIILALKNKI